MLSSIDNKFFQSFNQDPRRGNPPVMMLKDNGAMILAYHFREKHGVEIFFPKAYESRELIDIEELEESVRDNKILDLIYGVCQRGGLVKAGFCLPTTIKRTCNYQPFDSCKKIDDRLGKELYEYNEVHRAPLLYFGDESGRKTIIVSDSVGNPDLKWMDIILKDERFDDVEIYMDEMPAQIAFVGGGPGRIIDRGSCVLDSLIFLKNALKIEYLPNVISKSSFNLENSRFFGSSSINSFIERGKLCKLPAELSKTAQSLRYFKMFASEDSEELEKIMEKIKKYEVESPSGKKTSSLLFRRGLKYAGVEVDLVPEAIEDGCEESSSGAVGGKSRFSIIKLAQSLGKERLEEIYDEFSGERFLRDQHWRK